MKTVNWDQTDAWHEAMLDRSEPLRPTFPDMFVMRFDTDDTKGFDGDLPNPINFHCKQAGKEVMIDAENIHKTHTKDMDIFLENDGNNGGGMMNHANAERYHRYHDRMPDYAAMHLSRKSAGHASHEGDTHTASLSFSGTMIIRTANGGSFEQHGTGHLGDSFGGSASIRAGHGSMAATGRPTQQRIV